MRKRCRDKNHPLRAAAPRFFQLGGKAALPSAMDIIFIYVAGNQFDCLPHLFWVWVLPGGRVHWNDGPDVYHYQSGIRKWFAEVFGKCMMTSKNERKRLPLAKESALRVRLPPIGLCKAPPVPAHEPLDSPGQPVAEACLFHTGSGTRQPVPPPAPPLKQPACHPAAARIRLATNILSGGRRYAAHP